MRKVSSKICLIFIIICLIFASCTSVKKTGSDISGISLKELNTELKKLEASCIINSTMNNQTFNFRIKINIAGVDTVSMTVFGPFGITVGRLYSDLNRFRFHNIMENSLYEGSPTEENIKKATNLSISVKDLLSLFQGKTPFKIKDYSLLEETGNEFILKRVDASNFGDFAVINKNDLKLVRYQRKDKGNVLILDSSFDKYKTSGEVSIPGSLNFAMPTVDGKMIIEIESFKINESAASPVKFDVPSSVTIIDLDKY
ncbi:MAG: DUF4292 domain-containing protein [Candidatus Kapabacteria bacterium]|nr:DUF4292 domain-containing protein [Ignavibacteriota bacterium]MCW5886167.1 DUF4292 domain-containing protein [Candidatus Kapabacteria bacterium]